MSIGWLIYYGLGFFFAAGVLTALLQFSEDIKRRVGQEGATKQAWVWVAIFAALGVIPFWLPAIFFVAFVAFWIVVIKYLRKNVRITMPKD